MGRRVIVADDSKTVQKVISIILGPAGYEVECFDNGNDALMAIKNSPPCLVLADVGMQHMDGYELGVLIKNEPRLRNTPVVLMYGSNYEINYEKFISSGAKDKILKPFDTKTLSEIARKHALKAVDAPDMGVINIDTKAAEKNIPEDWDMDSFAEPSVPDVKEPLKNVAESDLKEEFSNLELENTELEDESELSEEEAGVLYKEYNLKEETDGTIKFKDESSELQDSPSTEPAVQLIEDDKSEIETENDLGLWNDKFYIENPDEQPEITIAMDDEIIAEIPEPPAQRASERVPERVQERVVELPPELGTEPPVKHADRQREQIIDQEEFNKKLLELSEPIIRKMIRDILPDVAEKLVKEELNKLLAGDR